MNIKKISFESVYYGILLSTHITLRLVVFGIQCQWIELIELYIELNGMMETVTIVLMGIC
jgi:hypothetical protein